MLLFCNLFAPCHWVCIPLIFRRKKNTAYLKTFLYANVEEYAVESIPCLNVLPEIVCKFCLSRDYSVMLQSAKQRQSFSTR